MENLLKMKCTACRGGELPLTDQEIAALLPQVPGWKVVSRGGIKRLECSFKFANFAQGLQFANQIGALAEAEGHHPALFIEWSWVAVIWWTHILKGLHQNDFIMAAKTSQMLSTEA